MARITRTGRGTWLAYAIIVMLLSTVAMAAGRHQRRLKAGQYNPADTTVEMFSAIQAGDIEVKLIPKNSTQSRVLITNKTKRPLNVKLPAAFAGVPVLAQAGGLGGGGLGGGGRRDRGGGGSQSMGGGMGGMMGGMMNVKPEAVGNFKVTTVCLEHGKPEPRPQIPYTIKPIDKFTDKAEIRELCAMLGRGQINQRVAQAAAWHFSDDMTWQQLASKELRFANGTRAPYFSAAEINAAMQIASAATRLAKEHEQTKSEKSDSLSRP